MALDDLLKNLSKYPQFKELPIDSRTLLKTPTKTIIKEIKGVVTIIFESLIKLNI